MTSTAGNATEAFAFVSTGRLVEGGEARSRRTLPFSDNRSPGTTICLPSRTLLAVGHSSVPRGVGVHVGGRMVTPGPAHPRALYPFWCPALQICVLGRKIARKIAVGASLVCDIDQVPA